MLRDLQFGIRMLRHHPSFACAAIIVMVLGVGATTAVFSVLRGVLIEPLPYRDPARLVLFRADLPGISRAPMLTSLESLLFRVGAHDALTFIVVAGLLTSVALIATMIPAFRAARVDPMLALKVD